MTVDVSGFGTDELVPVISIPEATAGAAGLAWLPAYTSDGKAADDPWQSQASDDPDVTTTEDWPTTTTTAAFE